MSEAEFWCTSLRYLTNRMEGHRKALEIDLQTQYEVARLNALLCLGPYLPKNKKVKLTDIWKFQWELSQKELEAQEKANTPPDPKRIAELQEKLHKGLEAGTIKFEPVTANDLAI